MRRTKYWQLVLIGLVAGAIATAVAIFVPWLPSPASRQAGRIEFVYWFATVMCLVIFSVVAAILVYSIINFRAQPGDWSDGPPVHGNTTLEVIWTLVPAVLVTSLAVVSAVVLTRNGSAGTNPLVVKVVAQQFAWQFQYPNKKTYGILRLPVDRTVKLEITANDVIHSWWMKDFGVKKDAIPGFVNEAWFKVDKDKPGLYRGQCAELCGRDHGFMPIVVDARPKEAFTAWLKAEAAAQKQAAAPAPEGAAPAAAPAAPAP